MMPMASARRRDKSRSSAEHTTSLSMQDYSFPMRLQILGNNLTEAERRAGQYFLENPGAAYLSITEVVEDSELGYGTIIRFSRKLGCAGFQEFKVLLAQELALAATDSESARSSTVAEYAEKVRRELANTEKLIDVNTLSQVAKALNRANRVLIAGVAGSEPVAVGFDYRLSRIGINSSSVCEGYTVAIRAATLDSKDVFFAISFSGATKDILSAARVAKENGATVISLTNFIHAPLVEIADLSLFSASDRDPMSCEIFSNISLNFVLDVLFSEVFENRKGAREMVAKTFKAISDKRV